jgi:hypothetical protein
MTVISSNRRVGLAFQWIAVSCAVFAFGLVAASAQDSPPEENATDTSANTRPQNAEVTVDSVLNAAGIGLRGKPVTTVDEQGKGCVGKRHVTRGDETMVMLPDGMLVKRDNKTLQDTDRPFEPASKTQIVEELLSAKEFVGFKSRESKNYLVVYNTSENFSLGTSKILESMVPGLLKYMKAAGVDVHDPQTPLVAILFRTEEQFQKYRRMPPGVVAYYDHISNRIIVYEELEALRARPDLAFQQSVSTIAHEGAHQILHNIGVQQRLSRWPMWVTEGLAEYLAPTTIGKNLKWKGAGVVNDLRMFELEQFIKSQGDKPATGKMVSDTIVASRLTSTGYASAWALVHFLAGKRKKEFNAYLVELSKTEPLDGATEAVPNGQIPGNLSSFIQHFGGDALETETRLIAHLKKLPYSDPFADSPHFVAVVSAGQGRKAKTEVGTFHSPESATKWATEASNRISESAGKPAQVAMEVFPNRPQAEAYAKQFVGKK